MLYLTRKIELKPSQDVISELWRQSDDARRLYNLCLEHRRFLWRKFKASVSVYDQKRELTYLRPEYFSSLHSQTAQEVIFDLHEAYKSFFVHLKSDKTARPPRFRGRKYFYTLTFPQASYHLDDKGIVLHAPDGWLDVPFKDGFIDIERVKKFKEVKISCVKGVFYASIVCEVYPCRQITTGREIAFDPGVKTALTGFDGANLITVDLNIKRTVKHYDKLMDRLRSKIDRAKRGSKRHKRLEKVKKKVLSKRSSRVKQACHSISKELAAMNYDRYLIGDWIKKETVSDSGIKTKDRRINRAVQNQNPLGILVGYLGYKANLKSNQVEKVNERNSTRSCSCCGHRGPKLEPKIRKFICPECGFILGRDENAAVNLYNWYAAPVTGPLEPQRMSIRFVFGKHNACHIKTGA